MTQSKEDFKVTVLCKNFNKEFCNLVKDSIKEFVIGDSKTYSKLYEYIDFFENSDLHILRYAISNDDNSMFSVSFLIDVNNNLYIYGIDFKTIDDSICLKIYDSKYCELDDFTIFCRRIDIDTLFLLEEENASEPEQPEEDAEEPAEISHLKDCGLTESEENFLELLLIEEISRLSVLSSQSSDENTIELISEQLDTLVNIKDKLFIV